MQHTGALGTRVTAEVTSSMLWQTVNLTAGTTTAVTIGPVYRGQLALTATQPLLRGAGTDATRASLERARAVERQAGHQHDQAASELARDVLTAYWELWYAQRAVEVQAAALALATQQLDEATRRQQALGTLARADVLRFATEQLTVQDALAVSTQQRDARALELSRLLARQPAGAQTLVAVTRPALDAYTVDLESALALTMANSSEWLAVMAELEAAEEALRATADADQARLDLILSGSMGGLWTDDMLSGLSLPGGRPAFSVGGRLELELPVGGGRADAAHEQARAQLLAARSRAHARELAIETELATLFTELETAPSAGAAERRTDGPRRGAGHRGTRAAGARDHHAHRGDRGSTASPQRRPAARACRAGRGAGGVAFAPPHRRAAHFVGRAARGRDTCIMKRALLALVLLGAIGGAVYYFFFRPDPNAGRPRVTVRVTRGELVEYAGATGTIQPDVQVEIRSRESGEVIEVMVQEGQVVTAGTPLIRLDPFDTDRIVDGSLADQRRTLAQLREAEASLAVAEAELGQAGITNDVSARGQTLGLVSDESARATEHQRAWPSGRWSCGAQVAAAARPRGVLAPQRLRRAPAARGHRHHRTHHRHRALGHRGGGLHGHVGGHQRGRWVRHHDAGGPRRPPRHRRHRRGPDRLRVGGPGRADPRRCLPRHRLRRARARVSPLGTNASNVVTFDVEIVVTDERAGQLRSGMSADVEIVTSRQQDVLLIPLTAVRSHGAESTVLLADGQPHNITTGGTDGTSVVVMSGLNEGDEISADPNPPRAEGEEAGRPSGSGGSALFGSPGGRRRR
ncbi:MAG: TolC family protein [Sandaracinaceae bacterium]|nr:TolC family protein [Sandaracinaceae bacterium]